MADGIIPISGRQLVLPDGPIFHLHRAEQVEYEIGAFRQWAGYKEFGSDVATDGLALFQHVLSFGPTEQGGRTGIHCHLAHAHVVIPTSGRALFSYDGVVTEAVPGSIIVQHGGTIHDQFQYSYAATSRAENCLTPRSVDPAPADAPPLSFGFLELFVPKIMAHVEIIAPEAVSDADQHTAWAHPYHAAEACYALQTADDPGAAFGPVRGHPDIEARDGATWDATGGLVSTWIIRPASSLTPGGAPLSLEIAGEQGGIDILYMVAGSASVLRDSGETVVLQTGDAITCSQGAVGQPFDCSLDMRLLRFFIAAKAQRLRERTPAEIAQLQDLGAGIITRRELRPDGDARPVNFMQGA